MAAQKPSIPKGTRDFGPAEMARRTYMFDTIKSVFRAHGFQPLETPAMENLSTLMGKYGEEGDKLLFKVLNSGDFMSDFKEIDSSLLEALKRTSSIDKPEQFIEPKYSKYLQELCSKPSPESITEYKAINYSSLLAPHITEKGLRYDLTVPFARYVVQHQSDIVFPFRRYQVQPVWRADRPQKGRYREFYQCDVDIIGSTSLVNEVELVQMVDKVFGRLGIRIVLKLNNRKILAGIAESIGHADKMTDITVAIDKLDKIGIDAVREELSSKGISREAADRLQPILELTGTNSEKLDKLEGIIAASETGMRGIGEMRTIFGYIDALELKTPVELDLSLARGLNYYTGAIFEVKALDFAIGSICGGGRYDDLTGIFGMPDTSGVGISFGADRIYDVMLGLGLFPDGAANTTAALFVNFGGAEEMCALRQLAAVRERGVAAEIYPDAAKMKKQMDYANRRAIPCVVIIGGDEMTANEATVKDMRTGEQSRVAFGELTEKLTIRSL